MAGLGKQMPEGSSQGFKVRLVTVALFPAATFSCMRTGAE